MRTNMADDDTIRATVVEKMHNAGYYRPRGVDLDVAAQLGVASHDRGRAKELIADMVRNEDAPVLPKHGGKAVMLAQDKTAVARWIQRHGGDEAVPWDLQEELK